jgi:hypothetical protein
MLCKNRPCRGGGGASPIYSQQFKMCDESVQIIRVTPGAAYNLSYYLRLTGGASNNFTITNSWRTIVAGQVFDYIQGSPVFGDELRSVIVNIPPGVSSTNLTFQFREVRPCNCFLLFK